MPRFSKAYSILVERLTEVKALERIASSYSKLEPLGSNDRKVNALCRGAIVLLCAHIEGFAEDLAEIILRSVHKNKIEKSVFGDAFRFHFSKDIVDEIRNTNDPSRISRKIENLVSRDFHIWSSDNTFQNELEHKRFMKGFSTPSTTEIYKLFGRFGFSNVRADLGQCLKNEFIFCENTVNAVVDTRNKIAHGDYLLARTPEDIKDMRQKTQVFCRTLDKCVADSCRGYGFSIR